MNGYYLTDEFLAGTLDSGMKILEVIAIKEGQLHHFITWWWDLEPGRVESMLDTASVQLGASQLYYRELLSGTAQATNIPSDLDDPACWHLAQR